MRTVHAKLKWFSLHKGFGFLTSDEVEGDIFIHATVACLDGWTRLPPDAEFVAEIEPGQSGRWRAVRLYPARQREAQSG